MRYRYRDWLGATLVASAIIIALARVASPELRALLILMDSLGLDLLALLFAAQIRHFGYALLPAAKTTFSSLCALVFCIGCGAMRTYPKALPLRPFDKLFCPALVFVTYGIRCGVAR